MPYRQKRFLLDEIIRQCDFVLVGYLESSTAVQKNEPGRMWFSLHALFSAAVHLRQLLMSAELEGILGEVPGPLADPELAKGADWAQLVRSGNGSPCAFDPRHASLTLFGAVYQLQPLLTATAELRQRAESQVQHLKAMV